MKKNWGWKVRSDINKKDSAICRSVTLMMDTQRRMGYLLSRWSNKRKSLKYDSDHKLIEWCKYWRDIDCSDL
ncbi:MAG: hypothetical protein R2764_17980 [Bacteroidales bacterium]